MVVSWVLTEFKMEALRSPKCWCLDGSPHSVTNQKTNIIKISLARNNCQLTHVSTSFLLKQFSILHNLMLQRSVLITSTTYLSSKKPNTQLTFLNLLTHVFMGCRLPEQTGVAFMTTSRRLMMLQLSLCFVTYKKMNLIPTPYRFCSTFNTNVVRAVYTKFCTCSKTSLINVSNSRLFYLRVARHKLVPC
jgi:hypothetical protein